MRLIQFVAEGGARGVARIEGDRAIAVKDASSMIALAQRSIAARRSLDELVAAMGEGDVLDYPALLSEGRVLAPVDHPDPAHCLVTGTGLTHLGSADTRDKMHKTISTDVETLSDSMKMFRMGLEGGKPKVPGPGVQPEWFYKGDGSAIVPPGADLPLPGLRLMAGRSRRSPGSMLSIPAAGHGASVSPWATNIPITSWSGRTISISRTPSCAPAPSARSCARGRCRTSSRAKAVSSARVR